MNTPVTAIHSTQHDYRMPTEDEIMSDFDPQSSDFGSEYARSESLAPEWLVEEVSDPFEEVRLEEAHNHTQRIQTLLLDFVARNRSFSVEQICGPSAWSTFTDDEKYQAEYLIAQLITELNLPLQPNHSPSYPAPRRYSFM